MRKKTVLIYPSPYSLPFSVRYGVLKRCRVKCDDFPEAVVYGSFVYVFWSIDLPVERYLK